jgi:uncharacterized membrane protein
MQYALILVAALHVLATVFWAGSTFALARTGGAAMERLFKPQLAAAVLAFVTGGYLGHTLHAHAFGRPEQLLFAAIAASAVALVVQVAVVGRAVRALRDGARDQAGPRALATTAHRVAAMLLALAAIGMATARYLPPSPPEAAGAPGQPEEAKRDRPAGVPSQAVARATPRPRGEAVPVTAPAGLQ